MSTESPVAPPQQPDTATRTAPSSRIVHTGNLGRTPLIEAEVGGRRLKAGYTWFRGETTNFLPDKALLAAPDAIQTYLLAGLVPKEPFIDESTSIVAFGSCFASNISKYLNARHFNIKGKDDSKAYVVIHGEGMVHSYAIRQQFEWALEGVSVNPELWHDRSAKSQAVDEQIRVNTGELFLQSDVFILTFGLSEVWYSKETGDVFWRGVPAAKFDPERHGFRVVTAEENRENLEAIYRIIRKHRPGARIVFTLSPVPLVATFRPVPCFVANSYSKASLRVAIDDVLRAHALDDRFFYWPSYEIVTDYFPDAFFSDRRHPSSPVVDHIMRLFEEYFCIRDPENERVSLAQSLTAAMIYGGALPKPVVDALLAGDGDAVRAFAAAARDAGENEYARLLDDAADFDPSPYLAADTPPP